MYTFLSHIDGKIVKLAECRLTFKIGIFELLIDFDSNPLEEVLSLKESHIEISSLHKELLTGLPISSIAIRLSVFVDEDTTELYPLAFEASKVYKIITSQFPFILKNIPNVEALCVEDPCDGLRCPEYGFYYGWEASIDNVYWNSEQLYIWLERYKLSSDYPQFYNECSYKLSDSLELKILSINTKVRRLGYLKLLVSFFEKRNLCPISKFQRVFEHYCGSFDHLLDQRSESKGIIVETKTGYSAKPYIELGVSLGIIRKDALSYRLGKIGKTYAILKNIIDGNGQNVFDLTDFDVFFFLERLLSTDFWYLSVILKYIFEKRTVLIKDMRSDFKELLLKDIIYLINSASEQNPSKVLPLKIIERRIMSWAKPEVYMEHVVTPRINWLLDLGLLELTTNQCFKLTLYGEQLFYNIQLWNDVRKNRIISPADFINAYFCKIMNIILGRKNCQLSESSIIEYYLKSGFSLFETLAPNRINFSQFALYLKSLLFFKNNKLLDVTDLINLFENNKLDRYLCKLQSQYNDGYIQKRELFQ